MKKIDIIKMHPHIHQLKSLERKGLYILNINNKVKIPVILTHFYKNGLRFKVLSNPSTKKQNKRFFFIAYTDLVKTEDYYYEFHNPEKITSVSITKITINDLPKYLQGATEQLFEVLNTLPTEEEKQHG